MTSTHSAPPIPPISLKLLRDGSFLLLLGSFFVTLLYFPTLGLVAITSYGSLIAYAFLLSGFLGVFAYSLFKYIVPSFRILSAYHKDSLTHLHSDMRKGFGLGLLVMAGALGAQVAALYLGQSTQNPYEAGNLLTWSVILSIAGGVILLMGFYGLYKGLNTLARLSGDAGFATAGILLLLGIFIPFLQLAGWIKMYIVAGKNYERMMKGTNKINHDT